MSLLESKSEGAPVNLVVADHDMQWMMGVVEGISKHPQIKVVGFAQRGEDVIDRAVSLVADAVLMEYALVDMTAGEVAVKLAEKSPGTAVFALSASLSMQLIQQAQAKGVIEIFDRNTFSAREAAEKIAALVDARRRQWAETADKHGILEAGVGPRGRQPVRPQVVTRPVTQTIVLVHSRKGGVGKTTISTNLATAIKLSPILSGLRVALLDFDPDGTLNLSCHLSDEVVWNRNICMWEHLSETLSLDEVDDLMVPTSAGVMVLPAPPNPAVAQRVTVELADKVLRVLRKYYGIIVIDGGPKLAAPVDAAMYHATHILLVSTPEGAAVRKASEIVRAMMPDPDRPEKPDMSHMLRKMFVVVNRIQNRRGDLKSAEVAQAIGRLVIAEIPEDENVAVAMNSNRNKQAIELVPDSPFAMSIKKLANDLCGAYPAGVNEEVREKRPIGGFSGLLARLRKAQ